MACVRSGNGVPIVNPPTRVAGYFTLDRTYDARMFYFYFQARNPTPETPVVLWMTGGPGCSSELAVFYENGPYTINADMTLTENKFGWDVNSHMIFIDQPIGTGFSYSEDERDRVFDEKTVGDDMLDFLQEFFAVHPEIADNDFFVTGESYAGHYVPTVAHRIWAANRDGEGRSIALAGIAIGNGLTDPAIQYGAYGPFALQNKLISQSVHDGMQFLYPLCRWGANLCTSTGWDWVCGIALTYCQATTFGTVLALNPGINVYDITKQCEGALCYDFTLADQYLNSKAVRAQLHVNRTWEGCSMDVNADFFSDISRAYDGLLPEMLADGIRVLIYAGERDLICNWLGNLRWVDSLAWDGAAEWALTSEEPWQSDGKVAGSVRSSGPLTFLKVARAGHMVPMDQPQAALDMISTFTRSQGQLASKPRNERAAAAEKKAAQRSFRGWSLFPGQQEIKISAA
ncbi:MAG: hypothetical protein WDW38_007198 [Sanguina aurantia]